MRVLAFLLLSLVLSQFNHAKAMTRQETVTVAVGEGQTLAQVKSLAFSKLVSTASENSRQYVEGRTSLANDDLRSVILRITPSFQKVTNLAGAFSEKEGILTYTLSGTVEVNDAALDETIHRILEKEALRPTPLVSAPPYQRAVLPAGKAPKRDWSDVPTLLP
jgi:hypothetical protein